MYRHALVLTAVTFLAACSSKPAPAPPSSAESGAQPAASQSAPAAQNAGNDAVEKTLQKTAGDNATNCGAVASMAADEVKKASDCAMAAAKGKKAFYVSYAMPGLTVGIAGTSAGKLFNVQSDQQAQPSVEPCPAELRIAQSGRVTCIKAGAVGTMPGSQNPHAGPHGSQTPMAPKSSH